jgi:hypothetical protein
MILRSTLQIALAALYELSHDYMLGEMFFLLISVAGIITASALFHLDERTGALLRTHIMKPDSPKDGHENGFSSPVYATPRQEVYSGTPPLGGSGPSPMGQGYGSIGDIVV